MKTLDQKLSNIQNGKYRPTDFIIADAKDADMGGGVPAPGPSRHKEGTFKTYPDYLQAMREMTQSGWVDIMLMSAASAEILVQEALFDNSPVTPAIRLNDATDIWGVRGGSYFLKPPQNFSTAALDRVRSLTDLGLYSITFQNNLETDLPNLQALKDFRQEASAQEIRYFLEVFNPKIANNVGKDTLPFFINDCIVRCLAGVTAAERPLFLKMQYNGAEALQELANYDPQRLIVGILGGGKGTMRDTFELVHQIERFGARVALFGRKINLAEAPIKTVELMRQVVQHEINSEEAVKMYHDFLKQGGIAPLLPLAEDLEITEAVLKPATSA